MPIVDPIGKGQITEKNLRKLDTGAYTYDDESALSIVLDDLRSGDAWMNQQNWPSNWSQSYEIYQSPTQVSCFDGGGNATAHVPNFTVSNICDAVVPKIMGGLFYESPPFLLRPRPGTEQDIIDAKTALFAYQLDDMNFEEEMELGILQDALIGTMVMKWGWTERQEQREVYRRMGDPLMDAMGGMIHTPESDDFEVYVEEYEIHRPWIRACDRRCVLTNSGLRQGDIRKAKWVIYRDYATYEDLDSLRGFEGYDIPSEDDLKEFFMRDRGNPGGDNISVTLPESMRGWLQTSLPRNFKDSADPLQNGLEIIERWDKDKVIVVLTHNGDNILIRNEANPYGKVPFYSAVWRPILDCFDGQGIGTLVGSNQLVSQGITDLSLSRLDMGLQPTAVRSQGFNTPSQDIVWSQGGIIDVEGDVDKAFKFMTFPPQDAAAMSWLMQQQSEAKETSGANQNFTMGAGSPGVQTTGARSGTGAGGVIAANASRLDGPIGRIVRQIFVPWLRQMDELNNKRLPTTVLRQVLNEKMGKDFQLDHQLFRNAKLEYEVLAGSKLGPKKEMAQFFPFLIQLINNPTFATLLNVAGYKFDVVAAFKNFAAFAGWKYSQDFAVKMTPEEQQKADAQLPAAIQAQRSQSQSQLEQQKFQQETQRDASKELAKAGGAVARTTIEKGMEGSEFGAPLTGESGL